MIVGGSTTSLLSLLGMIDYDKFDVDLQLQYTQGILSGLIPSNVNILPMAYKYPHSFYKWIKILSPKSVIRFIKGKRIGGEGRTQFMEQDICKFARDNNKFYDVAISYLERWPLYYLVDKVKAKRKIAWIHTDYVGSQFHIELDLAYFKQIDSIVFVAQKCAEGFKAIAPELKEKVVKIENLLSSIVIRQRSNTCLNQLDSDLFNDECFKLISVCRISFADKGLDRGVLAFAKLREEGMLKNLKWYIIGDGPMYATLKKMIYDYHLQNEIILIGLRKNPLNIEKKCDVYFLPSRYEGKPMAVTEAQMLGLVPLITKISAAEEIVQDGSNGFICENSQDGIYEGLSRVIRNKDIIKDKMKSLVYSHDYSNIEEYYKVESLINNM